MKVVVLGGTGRHGRRAAWLLAGSNLVTEVVLAVRDVAAAADLAARIGDKASASRADVFDESSLDAVLVGADMLVNASGPYFQTLLPGLRAAIRNGVHYCDFSEDGRTVDRAFALDGAARRAGITAIVGIGDSPGLTNLMAVHAARQLDVAEEIHLGWADDFEVVYRSAAENLRAIRDHNRVDASLQATLQAAAGRIRNYRDGQWTDEEALRRRVPVMLPSGQEFIAYPLGWAEAVMLPRVLPELRTVSSLVKFLPSQINNLIAAEGARIGRGEIDARAAAIAVIEALNREPDRWLRRGTSIMPGALFAVAYGRKEERPARYGCMANWGYGSEAETVGGFGTGAPAALAALKILGGEVDRHGVMPPEACFEPLGFFRDLVRRWAVLPGDNRLLVEQLDFVSAFDSSGESKIVRRNGLGGSRFLSVGSDA